MRLRAFLIGLIALAAAPARADPPSPVTPAERQSALCVNAIRAAEQRHNLPAGLLNAIGKVESGRPVRALNDVRAWPWTINADGEPYFFDTKEEAVDFADKRQRRGVHAMDVGCLQVDLRYHYRAFQSLDDAFDPAQNADYAARYLRELLEEANGNWFVAVGLYHSHSPDLAADYRARVGGLGAAIVMGNGGPEPLFMRGVRQGRLRLALSGGGVVLINTHRQPGRKHLSNCQVAAILAPLLARPPSMRGCGRT